MRRGDRTATSWGVSFQVPFHTGLLRIAYPGSPTQPGPPEGTRGASFVPLSWLLYWAFPEAGQRLALSPRSGRERRLTFEDLQDEHRARFVGAAVDDLDDARMIEAVRRQPLTKETIAKMSAEPTLGTICIHDCRRAPGGSPTLRHAEHATPITHGAAKRPALRSSARNHAQK